MAVSKRTRFEVLKRDNFTCRYCRSAEGELKVDHVVPIALGGSDNPTNLVAACQDCNSGKASTSLSDEMVADVSRSALDWSAAMAEAADALSVQTDRRQRYIDAWASEWAMHTWNNAPSDAANSLGRLYEAGLPIEVMCEAVQVTGAAWGVKNRFSYFMGICWKRVTVMQETARQLLEAQEIHQARVLVI